MVMSRDRNAGRSHSVKIDNTSIERDLIYLGMTISDISGNISGNDDNRYLGMTITDQNSIQEEIKSRLKLGNACYYSVQICCLPGCYPNT